MTPIIFMAICLLHPMAYLDFYRHFTLKKHQFLPRSWGKIKKVGVLGKNVGIRIEVYVRVHTEGGVERAYYHNCKQIGFSKMTQADVNTMLKKKKMKDICFFLFYYLK